MRAENYCFSCFFSCVPKVSNLKMDYEETQDLDFSEPIEQVEAEQETPNLVFTEDVGVSFDDIDDMDEPDQYVENANEDEADEQIANENDPDAGTI